MLKNELIMDFNKNIQVLCVCAEVEKKSKNTYIFRLVLRDNAKGNLLTVTQEIKANTNTNLIEGIIALEDNAYFTFKDNDSYSLFKDDYTEDTLLPKDVRRELYAYQLNIEKKCK